MAEEPCCRICRRGEVDEDDLNDSGTTTNKRTPLFYPCACKGSMKWVHEECLVQWLKHSKRRKCEVCGVEYSFRNIYSEDAPRILSLSEFVVGLFQRFWHVSRSSFRFVLVGFVWLVVVPLVTSWVWRLCFARAIQQTVVRIARRSCALNLLLTDCVYGSFLSAAIVFVFLGTASLREYLRQIRFAHNGNPNQVNLHLRDHLLEEEQQQQFALQGQNLRMPFNPNLHHGDMNDNWRPEGEGLVRQRRAAGVGGGRAENEDAMVAEGVRPRNQDMMGNPGGPFDNRDNLRHIPLQQQQQQQQQNVGGLDLERIEDVPFEELIGMQGPLLSLFENATTILLSNLFFLVASVMLPFNIGRVCMSILTHLNYNNVLQMARIAEDGATEGALGARAVGSQIAKLSMEAMGNLKIDGLGGTEGEGGGGLSMGEAGRSVNKLVRAATDFEAQLEPPNWKDLLTLGTGYMATIALGATIGFMIIFFRCLRVYTHREESLHRTLSLREVFMLVPLMAKRAYSYLAYSCVVLKTRMQFGLKAPITFTLIHWSLGIVYMFLVSVSVTVLREILKPGVLTFLRDPADPNINPFRELFEDPFTRHVRKIVLGSMIYGSVAMALVYMPVQFVKTIFPESFPIVIKLLDPLSELPIHLLMIHFGLPLTFEYLRPKRVMRFVIHTWLRFASRVFNVDRHILQPQHTSAGAGMREDGRPGDSGEGSGGPEGQEMHSSHHGSHLRHHHPGERDHPGAFNPSGQPRVSAAARAANNLDSPRKIGDVRSLLATGIGVYKESWNVFVQSRVTLNFRLALLAVTSCVSVQLLNVVLLSLPLFLGRQLCRVIGFPVHHDIYNILVGVYMIWGASLILARWNAIVSQLPALVGGACKYCVLGLLWLVVIPSVLGTLFHLTFVVPLTVPLKVTPIFFIYQDWAIGLVLLKVLHWRNTERLGQTWRNVEEIWSNIGSPSAIDFKWAILEVTMPSLCHLLCHLCLPYTFIHSVLPLCGVSRNIRQVLYRYGYALLAVGLQVNQWKTYVMWCVWKLHNTIRDDKYLVGKALKNMEHLHAS